MELLGFYFPSFEKADCTIFALSVGRSVVVTINFSFPLKHLEQKKNKYQNSNKRFALFTWSSS